MPASDPRSDGWSCGVGMPGGQCCQGRGMCAPQLRDQGLFRCACEWPFFGDPATGNCNVTCQTPGGTQVPPDAPRGCVCGSGAASGSSVPALHALVDDLGEPSLAVGCTCRDSLWTGPGCSVPKRVRVACPSEFGGGAWLCALAVAQHQEEEEDGENAWPFSCVHSAGDDQGGSLWSFDAMGGVQIERRSLGTVTTDRVIEPALGTVDWFIERQNQTALCLELWTLAGDKPQASNCPWPLLRAPPHGACVEPQAGTFSHGRMVAFAHKAGTNRSQPSEGVWCGREWPSESDDRGDSQDVRTFRCDHIPWALQWDHPERLRTQLILQDCLLHLTSQQFASNTLATTIVQCCHNHDEQACGQG